MATLTEQSYHSQPDSSTEGITLPALAQTVLRPLASLRLTVALFAMAIFIIWVGTLAQAEKDMWDVIRDYFWTNIAFIELRYLLPFQWFPYRVDIPLALGFPFPGGVLIGAAMAVNLLAAHLVRFRIQARGMPLMWGSLLCLLGAGLTLLVIISGHNSEGLQAAPPFSWEHLWIGIKAALVPAWLGVAWLLTRVDHRVQPILSWMVIVATVMFGLMLIALLTVGAGFYPGDSAMRIMWQLIQGGLAGLVILAGCLLLFKKRAGIVVIHLAVGLLLIGESFVSLYNVEERMQIKEGESINFARDIREVELALVDTSGEETDRHVVVPEKHLLDSLPRGEGKARRISNEQLPVDIEVVKYFHNSDVVPARPGVENPATAGFGLRHVVKEMDPATGADASGAVDFASAYVRLFDKQSGEPIGTYLVSQLLTLQDLTEPVTVGDTTYQLGLRFKRTYKPYSIHLQDVQKNDYIGTNTPRDYRSIVTLIDPSRETDRPDIEIWMNNPLRYAGETFYQSGYNVINGVEATDLQVVTNTGWMIPYVACSMALIGMAYHFMLTLVRFTNRAAKQRTSDRPEPWSLALGGAAVVLGLVVVGYSLRPAGGGDAMQLEEFGKLPVVYQGRVKPLDTLARNNLQIISDRQTFVDEEGNKQPAIRWLLDLMARPNVSERQRVVRIRNHEVLKLLKLEDTDDDRYSFAEIFRDRQENRKEFIEQLAQAHVAREKKENLSAYQRGLLDLESRLKTYEVLVESLRPAQLTPIPSEKELRENPAALATLGNELRMLSRFMPERINRLEQMQPPLAVPVESEDEQWQAYSMAWEMAQFYERVPYVIETGKPPEPPEALTAFNAMVTAYGKQFDKPFNDAVAHYRSVLMDTAPEQVNLTKTSFESFFNRAAPFTTALIIYIAAFLLSAVGLLAWNREFNRAAFWLIVVGLVVHTLALAARVYISERPPVTNLYSSAIFIGWAMVVLCLVTELIFRIGLLNLIGTATGVASLIIASNLGADGDTFTVMIAVLDTQFWLTTHVICVTIGYATTFWAGAFGIVYLIGRLVSPTFVATVGKDIIRMCYGAICFAIFFSFLGTVLGGLWADDSWGRFWGWDPKENGALIIVLWNALILHARWGGMIRERGLATLAVAGNIVTSWSWFGVNQLGIGLHSYGFTSGVVLALTLFVISQLAIMALAALPSQGNTPRSAAG